MFHVMVLDTWYSSPDVQNVTSHIMLVCLKCLNLALSHPPYLIPQQLLLKLLLQPALWLVILMVPLRFPPDSSLRLLYQRSSSHAPLTASTSRHFTSLPLFPSSTPRLFPSPCLTCSHASNDRTCHQSVSPPQFGQSQSPYFVSQEMVLAYESHLSVLSCLYYLTAGGINTPGWYYSEGPNTLYNCM